MSGRRKTEASIMDDYRKVVRAMDRIVLPALIERGVTMSQFKALIAITGAAGDGIPVTALGCELSISQPTASLLVDQLVKAGYASRRQDEADRRRVLVEATPAGEELVSELRQGRRSTFSAWLKMLSDEEANALGRGLRALADAAASADSAER